MEGSKNDVTDMVVAEMKGQIFVGARKLDAFHLYPYLEMELLVALWLPLIKL